MGMVLNVKLQNYSFNPIAPTLLKRALQTLYARHIAERPASSTRAQNLTKEDLDIIVESAEGDIRSAIMSLEFACGATSQALSLEDQGPGKPKAKKGSKKTRSEKVGTRRL